MSILKAEHMRPLFQEVAATSSEAQWLKTGFHMNDMDIIFTDTWWIVVGQMVWSEQPCKVSQFSNKFKIAEKLAFFMSTETLFFAPLFQNALI